MALKEPPQQAPARQRPGSDGHWAEKLSRAGYFLGAVLLHLIVFVMVATRVVFPPVQPLQNDFIKTFVKPSTQRPPPPATAPQSTEVPNSLVSTPSTAIISPSLPSPKFEIPMPRIASPTAHIGPTPQTAQQKVATKPGTMSAERAAEIKKTVTLYRPPDNILETNGDAKAVVAKFPVYLVSYADGDWGCNNVIDAKTNGIVSGSLPNLVAKMNEWGKGHLTGEVVPTPLDLSGPVLLDKKPPFIFFTGHKDFKLTDKEIQNLRDYLQIGGAIWGDNALAGKGSLFDIAFHREMKRVVPDPDKNFEPLPLTHDIFTKSWFPLADIPKGMNYYADPVEHLDIDGKLAILYTPNDYSDMFTMRILPGDTEAAPTKPDKKYTSPLLTNRTFSEYKGVFFRNYELQSCLACDEFAMNVVGYFLVRFDKDLLLTP